MGGGESLLRCLDFTHNRTQAAVEAATRTTSTLSPRFPPRRFARTPRPPPDITLRLIPWSPLSRCHHRQTTCVLTLPLMPLIIHCFQSRRRLLSAGGNMCGTRTRDLLLSAGVPPPLVVSLLELLLELLVFHLLGGASLHQNCIVIVAGESYR